jgi:hypothetical protein
MIDQLNQPFLGQLCKSAFRPMAIALLAVSFAGCASTPAPTEQMAVSKTAVDGATAAGGTEFAPIELKAAQDKMTAANLAMAKENYKEAGMLAQEAQVDAQLAATKARSAKAQKAVQDSQDSLRTLQDEINRNTQNNLQNTAQ